MKSVLNKQRKLNTNSKYFDSLYFSEGLASIISKDGNRGWVDQKGEIFKTGFKYTGDFYDGVALFKNFDDKYGWMNADGSILAEGFDNCTNPSRRSLTFFITKTESSNSIEGTLVDINNNTSDYLLFKNKNGLYSWINKKGNISTPIFDIWVTQGYNFDSEVKGLAKFEDNGKTGYVDIYGNITNIIEIEKILDTNDIFFNVKRIDGNIYVCDYRGVFYTEIKKINDIRYIKRDKKWYNYSLFLKKDLT